MKLSQIKDSHIVSGWFSVLALLLSGLTSTSVMVAQELPQVPLLKRDVHLQERGVHTRPAIPPYRITNDGRVAMDFRGAKQAEFVLFKPEAVDQPFDISPNGYNGILGGDVSPFLVDRALFDDSTLTGFGSKAHNTICDATPLQFKGSAKLDADGKPIPYGTGNPYSCAGDTAADCYDLTMIANNQQGGKVEIWSTPFTVKVKSPKTRDAFIESISVGTPVKGATHTGIRTWFEPIVSGDGLLFVGRDGFKKLFYSVADEGATPCDASNWVTRHEITHAYHDPRMWQGAVLDGTARYGIAAYPMRDGDGNLIPDGVDTKLSYPWMDKAGNNIVYTSVDATLWYQREGGSTAMIPRYPAECYVLGSGCIAAPEVGSIKSVDTTPMLRGIGVVGSWTHGKQIQIDNLVNNTDFGIGWGDNQHYVLELYSGSMKEAKIRVGGAGNIFNPQPLPGRLPLASPDNFTYIIDSVEHLFNDIPNMFPSTIRDTVWYMNPSKVTDKIIFDDWLNRYMVINSDWIPTMIYDDNDPNLPAVHNVARGTQHYRDGFTSTRTNRGSYIGTGFNEEIWFQNAATGLDWDVPKHGLAYAADSDEPIRAEPISNGGVTGRGLWLFENNNVSFSMPAQADKNIDDYSWYSGIYVDPSENDDEERLLLTYPDGSEVRITGRSRVSIVDSEGTEVAAFDNIVDSPNDRQWIHLGFQQSLSGARIDFYVNGYLFATDMSAMTLAGSSESIANEYQVLRMTEGDVVVGRPSNLADKKLLGFEGWTDEFKVVSDDVGFELACNYANGSILGLATSYKGDLLAQANSYPQSSHNEITNYLASHAKNTYSKYVCWHDYTTDIDVDIRYNPDGTVSVREHLIFPEGPLKLGSARPHTGDNRFCLSCHTDLSNSSELKLSALDDIGTAVEDDTRRQPAQGPRLVYGNLPANHFGLNLPEADTLSEVAGTVTDHATLVAGKVHSDIDGDNDDDGVLNKKDAWPNDSSRLADLDKDRLADMEDDDIDGDGFLNDEDAFPMNAKEWVDADADGIGDNEDVDSDNDGLMDAIDEDFEVDDTRVVVASHLLLNGEWTQFDSTLPGNIYSGKYVIRYSGDEERGLKHNLLQGSFDASMAYGYIDKHVGYTITAWKFIDSSGAEMRVELNTGGPGIPGATSATLRSRFRASAEGSFTDFGSVVVPVQSQGATNAQNTLYTLYVNWRADESSDSIGGVWNVKYQVNHGAITLLGDQVVSTTTEAATRTMQFTVHTDVTVGGRSELGLEYVKLTPIEPLGVITPNSAPTDITLSAANIVENNAINAVVGTLGSVDNGDSHSYSLVSGDGDTGNASFTINGDQLQVAVVFDYEAQSSYSIRVQTDDGKGGIYAKKLLIDVTDVTETTAPSKPTTANQACKVMVGDNCDDEVVAETNETPTDVPLSASSIAENDAVNALSSTDAVPMEDDVHSSSLVSGTGNIDMVLLIMLVSLLMVANYRLR